jgi:cell division protein FtsB
MKPLLILLFVLFLVLQYELWFGQGGVASAFHLRTQITEQQQQNNELQKQNNELINEIKNLKNNNGLIESKARNDLGMVKKGEVFYQVTK